MVDKVLIEVAEPGAQMNMAKAAEIGRAAGDKSMRGARRAVWAPADFQAAQAAFVGAMGRTDPVDRELADTIRKVFESMGACDEERRRLRAQIDCPICHEHTLLYACPFGDTIPTFK